jgi:hypothetical protein
MHILQDRELKTKQQRDCEWCPEAIEAKSMCRYRVYVNEDEDFIVGYQHPECYAAMLAAPYYVADSWECGSFKRGTDEEA